MLQIASGKLFRHGTSHENNLRGVIYSNVFNLGNEGIKSTIASVNRTDSRGRVQPLIFEMVEKVEGLGIQQGVIQSFGIDRYQDQFASLMSFFLGLTFNSDRDLVIRLTDGRRGLGTRTAPNQLIRRIFDVEVATNQKEIDDFTEFLEKLLSLERKHFLAATRAIQTFVTGLHRMGDDLETAYTLMVASLEALAMEFDGHLTTWEDVEDKKRESIEEALNGAPPETAEKVKSAVASVEHVLLRRRFKEFTLAHLPKSYFIQDAIGKNAPLGRLDLSDALDFAYAIRSAYVHELRKLPHEISDASNFSERLTTIEGRTAISFQGLYRVAHSVIIEFVRRQSPVSKNPYDYALETGSMSLIRLAASMWLKPQAAKSDNGRKIFEGFLEMFCEVLSTEGPSEMADLKGILEKIEPALSQMNDKNRRPYVAITVIAKMFLPTDFHAKNQDRLIEKWGNILENPSIESLLVHALCKTPPAWPHSVHESIIMEHLRLRSKKSGFSFPRRFDAAMILALAERYRVEGAWENAQTYLQCACEEFPEFQELRDLMNRSNPTTDLHFDGVLFPKRKKEDAHLVFMISTFNMPRAPGMITKAAHQGAPGGKYSPSGCSN